MEFCNNIESGVFYTYCLKVFIQFFINKAGIPSEPGDEEADMVVIVDLISSFVTSMIEK